MLWYKNKKSPMFCIGLFFSKLVEINTMKDKFSLLENETIEFEIKKKRSFPFLVSDLLYVGMFFIFSIIFQTISYDNIEKISSETIFKIIPVFVLLFFSTMLVNQFYNRYINVFKWKIILTSFRLVVIDQKGFLINQFYLDNFPKLSYNEGGYKNGILIIGETVKTKEFPNRGYESISFDLYNIINVELIYQHIKNRIKLKIES